jgi:hypothetical protein
MKILFIDPGNEQSAYCVFEPGKGVTPAIVPNTTLVEILYSCDFSDCSKVGIEMIASYGMPVGKEVFETVLWIGEFRRILKDKGIAAELIYRKEIKMHLCNSMKAKDGNIAQALKDRFGDKGTKKNPGFFYGFKDDMWQAFAGCVYLHDQLKPSFNNETAN